MDLIAALFGKEKNKESQRKLFFELAAELEAQSNYPRQPTAIVETAKRLRDLLLTSNLELKRDEKIKLIKVMNRAKVRALMYDRENGYEVFSSLDSISSDVTKLL
jgi:hypothetical protein